MFNTLFQSIDWAQRFKKFSSLTREEIIERARKMEIRCKISIAIGAIALFMGVICMLIGETGAGVCGSVLGAIALAMTRISWQVYATTLWFVWDRRADQEAELRKSLAEDL